MRRVWGKPWVLAAVLAATAGIVAGCGSDDGPTTVIEIRTVTQPAPPPPPPPVQTTPAPAPEPAPSPEPPPAPEPESCGDVTFTENSGDGAFDVEVEGVSCAEAENLLRSDSGLTSWNCQVVRDEPPGQRYRCEDGEQRIEFTTGG